MSEARNISNLSNPQHSTGPRTEEGKAASSMNSLKHGLTAATVILPGEDPAEYQAFATGMRHDLDPLNTFETSLVTDLINLQWRLQRAARFEARILSAETPDFKALNNMSLHAARLKRQLSVTLKEFQKMHQEDQARMEDDFKRAEVHHRADLLLGRPSTVVANGFVFPLTDLLNWIAAKKALSDAKEVVRNHNYSGSVRPKRAA